MATSRRVMMIVMAVAVLMMTFSEVSSDEISSHQRVEVVHEGAPGNTINPYSDIQAEDCNVTFGCVTIDPGYDLYDTCNGDYVGFYQVDFGSGAQLVIVRLAGWAPLGTRGFIQFTLDTHLSSPFHTLSFGYTNGHWFTVAEFLDYPAAAVGVHDLYLKFTYEDSNIISFVDIDAIMFMQ